MRQTRLKEWLDDRRVGTAWGYGLRLAILLVGAALLAGAWAVLGGNRLGITLGLALGALAVAGSTWKPAVAGSLPVVAIVAVWWCYAGAAVSPWWAGVFGVGLLALHQLCAWASMAPLHAVVDRDSRRWLYGRGLALAGAGAVAAVVAVGLRDVVTLLPGAGTVAWLAAAVVALVGIVVVLVVGRGADA